MKRIFAETAGPHFATFFVESVLFQVLIYLDIRNTFVKEDLKGKTIQLSKLYLIIISPNT